MLEAYLAPELQQLRRLGRRLVVLTDPDEAGRAFRDHLDAALQSDAHHAFVAAGRASAAGDTRCVRGAQGPGALPAMSGGVHGDGST